MAVNGNDVYISTRAMGQTFKLSLHESGIWRAAYSQGSKVTAQNSTDRVEARWQRPPPFRPGWTMGPTIVTGLIRPKKPFKGVDKPSDKIAWFDRPRAGYKAAFTVLFSHPDVRPEDHASVIRSDDVVVGHLCQKHGGRVWVFLRYEKETSEVLHWARNFTTDLRINMRDPSAVENAVLVSIQGDDVPIIVDFALGRENVRLEP